LTPDQKVQFLGYIHHSKEGFFGGAYKEKRG